MKCIPGRNTLTIQLEGLERFWALKSSLRIPRDAIVEVNFSPSVPALQDFFGYIRFPGSNWFWRFFAGTFFRHGEREFWYVRMQQEGLLQIELKEGAFPYQRVRISSDAETAQAVADWWRQ